MLADPSSHKAMLDAGFKHQRRTYLAEVDVKASLEILPKGACVTLVERPEMTKAWLAKHKDVYFETHLENPPDPDADWFKEFVGDDFDPKTAFVCLTDEYLTGFGSLRVAEDYADVGWIWGANIHDIKAILWAICDAALARNILSITLEADTMDPFAMAALESASAQVLEIWDSYLRFPS